MYVYYMNVIYENTCLKEVQLFFLMLKEKKKLSLFMHERVNTGFDSDYCRYF